MSISVCAFTFFGITKVDAQASAIEERGQFGIRFMPTFTSLEAQSSDGGNLSGEVKMGFGAGIFLGYHFSNYVGIQGELIYSNLSQEFVNGDVTNKVKLSYVSVPLLLTLNTGRSKMINLNIVGGPQIGFNVGSRLSQTGPYNPNNPEPILSVRKNDLGFAYGAGVDFGLNTEKTIRLGLGYRGVLGLIDIGNNNNSTTDSYYVIERSKLHTNAIYLGISILF